MILLGPKRWMLSLSLLALIVAGCGPGAPPLFDVRGKVTLSGTPLTDGNITFENAGAGLAETVAITPDGTYSARLIEGPYTVTLMPVFVEQKAEDGTMEEVLKNPESFPEKYQSPESSGLKLTVTGETTFDIDMTP